MDPRAVLDNIIYARAYTYEHQENLLLDLAAKMAEEPFRLLIVDSVIALFRVDFTGRGELAERQQKLAQMLSRLIKIAEEFNVAVYMTNQDFHTNSHVKSSNRTKVSSTSVDQRHKCNNANTRNPLADITNATVNISIGRKDTNNKSTHLGPGRHVIKNAQLQHNDNRGKVTQVLSNETTRVQYDGELQFSHKPYQEKWSYNTEFEDEVRRYRWAYMRRKMRSERYWKHYNANEDYCNSEIDEKEDEGNSNEFIVEVLRSAFLSLLLFQTLGSWLSLTFSGPTTLFDRKLDAGYKVGYVIAWILGGRGGMMLPLILSFVSWVCGKSSSSVVALFMVAMWVGSSLSSYAPLPQGALLTLIYMSIKLQPDQI